jgi:hypothetical protein
MHKIAMRVAKQLNLNMTGVSNKAFDEDIGTAKRGEITPEQLQNMMAGGQELATLEGSLGGTV